MVERKEGDLSVCLSIYPGELRYQATYCAAGRGIKAAGALVWSFLVLMDPQEGGRE